MRQATKIATCCYCGARAALVLRGKERLFCELTLKDGTVKWDWDGRIGVDWRELPKLYGVRNPDGLIMPPPIG